MKSPFFLPTVNQNGPLVNPMSGPFVFADF